MASDRFFPRARGHGKIGPALEGLPINQLQDDELLALLLRTGSGQLDVMQLARCSSCNSQDGLVGLAGFEVDHLLYSGPWPESQRAENAYVGVQCGILAAACCQQDHGSWIAEPLSFGP